MSPRLVKQHPNLHGHPPLTPAGVLLRFRIMTPMLVLVFAFLAVAAVVDTGSLLLTWDEPVTRSLADLRSPGLDGVVKALSTLGGLTVVTLVLLLLLLLVWQECRSLALVLVAASVARPLLEWSRRNWSIAPGPTSASSCPATGPPSPAGTCWRP
jgi:hypothetical protein